MALSREERMRRAQRAVSGATTPRAPTAPRPRPQPTYSPPAPGSVREPTLKERQDAAWGNRAKRAWQGFEQKKAITGGAAVIAGTAYVNRRLQKRQTGGRPYGAKGKTTGFEYAIRSRDYMGQIPTYDALAEARKERMPRAIRRATIGPRRAFRSVDFNAVATGAAQDAKRRLTPKPRLKRTMPTPAGAQATNTRSLRSPVPSPRPNRGRIPAPAGTQATNTRPTPSPVDRVGTAQRASSAVRGGASRPAVFGSVKQSPMRQPGMLNIPRAGKQLTGMVQKSPEIPALPQQGKPKAAPKPKKVTPKPKAKVAPSESVKMPKPPSVKSVPKPKAEAPKPAAPKPVAPVKRTTASSVPSLKPEERPRASYRPSKPSKSVTDVKVKPPLAPSHATTAPKAAPPSGPKVVYEYEGPRGRGQVIDRGRGAYAVKYGESTLELPYSPSAESAKEPRPPSRRSKAKPSKTFRTEPPGEQQWKALFGELEKRGGRPTSLTASELRSARAVGVSEGAALRQKQRAWEIVDPVERNISKATGSRPPGPKVKAGERGVPNKSGRYAVKLAKAAGLMSGAGAVAAVAEPLISPETASAAMAPKAKREAQRQFLDRMRRMGRAEKATQKYFGGVFR